MLKPAARSTVHLLMVDDNSLGLQARKAVLEELGYRVTTAGNAEDALEQLAAGSAFDIVITDYKLPAQNGKQLIQEILKRKMPVSTVLLSGFVDAMGMTEANTGADVVLQKSAHEVSQLVRSVKGLLKRRKPMGEAGPGPGPERKKA
jgi:CheY-like chemotaxis protein